MLTRRLSVTPSAGAVCLLRDETYSLSTRSGNRLKKYFAIAACPALTVDGAAAIYLFTCESPLYHQLNEKLRARNRAELKVRGIEHL